MSTHLTNYTEAARELETTGEAIKALVVAWGITPKPFPSNGKAKGLDAADMRVLRRALNKARRTRHQSVTA